MTDAQDLAREALKSWAEDVDIDGDWLAGAVPSLLDEWGLSIVDTGELERLRKIEKAILDALETTPEMARGETWITVCLDGEAAESLRAAVAGIE